MTRAFAAAKPEAAQRLTDYERLFARLPAAPLAPEAIQAELAAIKQRAESRRSVADLPMLATELERIRQKTQEWERQNQEWEAQAREYDRRFRQSPEFTERMRSMVSENVARLIGDRPIARGTPEWNAIADKLWPVIHEIAERHPSPQGETISQAADAWFTELQRTDVRPQTLDGHRLRVRAFVEHAGDIPIASVTRAAAADWLTKIAQGRSNRTVNAYSVTMRAVFDSAKQRGRFTGENPFSGQKRKAGGESYQPFEISELQKIFDSMPREIAPRKHTPETALPWVALIAAYSGARLEEIAQLAASDVRAIQANGSTVTVIDIHNGGNNTLKNGTSARLIPVHSELVRAGFLDYVKALPQNGPLFPGLKRRASKGKIGARIGELFRKKLIALGLKRDGLCFHSFRHTVANRLDAAEVRQSDAARVLGHAVAGMSFGTYSQAGPGLKIVAGVIEQIQYPELKVKPAA